MTEDEARERIAVARVGRLASIDGDGRPRAVPICFAMDGCRVVSVVDAKPKLTVQLRRLENLRRKRDVQFVVDHCDEDWSSVWWVRISRRASVIEHGAVREARRRHAHGQVSPIPRRSSDWTPYLSST